MCLIIAHLWVWFPLSAIWGTVGSGSPSLLSRLYADWAAILARSSTVAACFFTFMRPPDGAPAGCFVPRRRLHPPAANVHLLHSWRSAAPKGKKKVVCSFATFKDETIHTLPEVKCSLYEFVSRLTRPSHRNRRKLRLKSTFIGCWLFWKPQAHRWRSWQTQ